MFEQGRWQLLERCRISRFYLALFAIGAVPIVSSSAAQETAWVPSPTLQRWRSDSLQDTVGERCSSSSRQVFAGKYLSGDCYRRWRLPARGEALLMSKTAKEGGAVKSAKAGPLKQEDILLPLPSGVSMEALFQKPSTGSHQRSKALPPLVFIHGSYHAAWCWAEHWMPFLAGKGYDTFSISLRGTSGTRPSGHDRKGRDVSDRVKVKIKDHLKDVRAFVETVLPDRKPVFIAHSFGGLVLLKLMEQLASEGSKATPKENGEGDGDAVADFMSGGVFLCSVPPSGNGPMSKRFLKERPVSAVKIVVGFVLRMAVFWPWLARDLFFCQSLDQSALRRYMVNFRADSKNGLDLGDLRRQLPSRKADATGKATWINQSTPPRLVMGGDRDRMVDETGVKEMATFLNTDYLMLPTVPHEVMLGPDWPVGVNRLLQWLESTDFQRSA